LARPLSEYVPRLSKLTFQADLGSMLDKMERLQRLVPRLAPALRLSPQDLQLALAAARLCRADLVTHMVVEMTSLQGEMGRYYARQSGEPPEVAQAIFESYLPRHGGDHLPRSKPGLAVAVADRLDTLVGLFAVGLQPSGAKDPFALRRTSIGLVQILVEAGQRFDLRDGLKEAASGLPIEAPDDVLEGCLEFIVARQRALLLAEGHRYDAVDAVLTEQGNDPTGADQAVKQLEAWIERPDWDRILQAYARCARITRDVGELPPPDPDRFIEGETRRLHLALLEAQHAPRSLGSVYDLLSAFEPMIPAITSFFDEVLVMDDDPLLRQNRLALLRQVVALADDVVDLSQLEGF
jgi:glycyl-tRNA synthetase